MFRLLNQPAPYFFDWKTVLTRYFFIGLFIALFLIVFQPFGTGESVYNKTNRPYIEPYSTSIMFDFSLGYYLHNPDINIALGYRGYSGSTNTYGAFQRLERQSVVLEGTKYLLDYHGFAPFIGPAISYESLQFEEFFENQLIHNINDTQLSYGITFGWDIRPNRLQSWILRTNLRWFPNLQLAVESGNDVSFNNLEFNFIQLIIYPNRLFKKND